MPIFSGSGGAMPDLVVEESGLPERVGALFKQRCTFESGLLIGTHWANRLCTSIQVPLTLDD